MPSATATSRPSTGGNVSVTKATPDKKPKVEKVKKIIFRPADRDEKGRLKTKIVGKDTGEWDAKIHLPLKRNDFEHPADYLELLAERLEKKIASVRAKAESERKLGTVKDRVKARRFQALHAKFASLEKELRDSGMSNDAIASLLAG